MEQSTTQEQVETYLKEHPSFIRSWVIHNVPKDELRQWVERPDLQKEVNNEGQSLPGSSFKNFVSEKKPVAQRVWRTKEQLKSMDHMEMFMELIWDITTELDINALCHKILVNVGMLTNSDRGSMFLAKSVGGKRFLVSKLFDVSEDSLLSEVLHADDAQILVPFGVGIAGAVAETKKSINIKDAYKDSRFNKAVDKKTGYRTKSILCRPILNYDGGVIGVAQIMNKTDGTEEFTSEDEKVFRNYLSFCGIGLANAQLFEMSVLEHKRNKLLLRLAQNIFEVQSNLDDLIRKIILDAEEMLKAERCSVWLVAEATSPAAPVEYGFGAEFYQQCVKHQVLVRQDGDTYAKHEEALARLQGKTKQEQRVLQLSDVVFDKVYEHHSGSDGDIKKPSIKEVSTSPMAKIAVEVAVSRKPHNISDSRLDERFSGGLETPDGQQIISLLTVPIENASGSVLGVVQLLNKDNEKPFNEDDINNLEAFALFCGLGINNCQMYESVCKLMAKQQVALEVLSFHASASDEEAQKLTQSRILSDAEYKLDTYEFDDISWTDDDTCRASLRMFMDLGIVEEFHVPMECLARWILSVRKNYRPVTYHNWRHAFNVAQSMYTIIKRGGLGELFTKLEMYSLIVACLCHDLDHRGTNNAFQSKTASPLATIYSTSTMEHHHFDQCIMIINTDGNNIFGNLDADSYKKVIKMVEKAILSTDLALYFRKKGTFQMLVDKGQKVDWSDEANKELLRAMMMTACDVAAITKPWNVQLRVAHLVANEFFEQGDFERNKLGLDPIAMMDREKQDELPKMQVGFIDAICLPLYQLLAKPFEGVQPLLDGCNETRERWNERVIVGGQTDAKSKEMANGHLHSNEKAVKSQTCTIL